MASLAGVVPAGVGPVEARAPRTFVVAESVLVHGLYPESPDDECDRSERSPLHVRLPGRVEVGAAGDGTLFVINELPFETYLEGIAEVPRDWPRAALEAQVIAARTYALGHLGADSDGLGYDLCATDACQVYRGMQISHGPWGERWRAAVDATRGRALLYQGRPASTLYFSTSNGRTYGNEEVFEGAGPLPYLRPVREDDDGASPVSRWTARIPLSDVTGFLRSSGEWTAASSIASITQEGPDLVLRGGGRSVRISKTSFRIAINDRSTCLDPGDYPGIDLEEPGEARTLPQTIPSKWFDGRTEGGAFVADGRGWGHGVGMVQWGAYGKARRGLDAADILAAYYGGLRPQQADVPGTIRVLAAEGLRSVTLVPESTSAKGDRLPGDGPWRIDPASPLSVRTTGEPRPALEARVLSAPARVRTGSRATIRAEGTPGVVASIALVDGDGSVTELPARRPHQRGEFTQHFRVPAALKPGEYRVVVRMSDGIDSVARRAPEPTLILAGPAAAPSPSPEPSPPVAAPTEERNARILLFALGAAAIALALGALLFRRISSRS